MILWPLLLTEVPLGFLLAVPANSGLYKVVFPSAHTPAHLALAAAASLALTAGLLRRSFFWATFGVAVSPLALAHLALVPAIIAALPAALNRRLSFFAGWAAVASVPLILAHLACWVAAIPKSDKASWPQALPAQSALWRCGRDKSHSALPEKE